MAIKPIIKEERSSILRRKAKSIPLLEISSKRIRDIIRDMSATLRASPDGIGIAAPQIGISLQLFLASEEALHYETRTKKILKKQNADETESPSAKKQPVWRHFVFINPRLLKASKKTVLDTEGCLSVPGTYGIVARPEKVKVVAYDEYGKKFERGASGLFARLLQHEIDHLEGVLFVDKARQLFDMKQKKT